jgi:uncharacterized protein (TIGR04255 family)
MDTLQLEKLPRPSFENPPVVEVVMGLQFDKPHSINMVDFAKLWEEFGKEEYSDYKELAPLERMVEGPSQIFKFSNLPEMRRVWFENPKENTLIQTQEDRLIFNWRRPTENLDESNCYPRYEKINNEFFSIYDRFEKYLQNSGVEVSKPDILELTYMNFIEYDGEKIPDANAIFKDFNWFVEDRILNRPSFIDQKLIYEIPDMLSKLKCTIKSYQNPENGNEGLIYELSVRGTVNELERKNMQQWYNNARLWIVHGFKDSTNTEMHKKWGISDE